MRGFLYFLVNVKNGNEDTLSARVYILNNQWQIFMTYMKVVKS